MTDTSTKPVVLVGNPEPTHVGGHLLAAAQALGATVHLCDVRDAYEAPLWKRKMDWWLRGHRPSALRLFSDHVVETVDRTGASAVISTGIAPLDAPALTTLGARGIRRLNFLTDDPWNPANHAPWFLRAVRHYDHIFTPRRANSDDLRAIGGPSVSYLPFAYRPDVHFPEPPEDPKDVARFTADLVFIGGADVDRVRFMAPIIHAGFDVALYGGYWDSYPATRRHARGFLDAAGMRKATGGACVSLCLVRRANRDGHAMRSFELAAMGGCMLVEDTADHRELFGKDGDAVIYFSQDDDAVARLRELISDPAKRRLLSTRVRQLMAGSRHTYDARLRQMLQRALAPRPKP